MQRYFVAVPSITGRSTPASTWGLGGLRHGVGCSAWLRHGLGLFGAWALVWSAFGLPVEAALGCFWRGGNLDIKFVLGFFLDARL